MNGSVRIADVLLVAALPFIGACSGDEQPSEPECLQQPADLDCMPLYGIVNGDIAPTFTELFQRTLAPTCGNSSACHASAGAKGGLVLDDEQTAYDRLLAEGSDGRARVRPGDVQCGKVIVRLESIDEPWSMPPGAHLDEPTLCVIRHGIANGAPR